MKKLLASLVVCLALTGCSPTTMFCKEPDIVVKQNYVYSSIPDDILAIPAPVDAIDLMTATDKDVSLWLTASEYRAIELEQKLKQVKQLQDKQKADLQAIQK